MKVSAMDDRNWIRLSDVEGAIKGTQESLRFAVSTSAVDMRKMNDSPVCPALLSEGNRLLRGEINDNETVGTSLSSISDGRFFPVTVDGVVISWTA